MCGIIGIFKHEGDANVEVYEGLLSLQHRGQDSAGIVTTNWKRFHEHRDNGLVSDVFKDQALIDRLTGVPPARKSRGVCSCSWHQPSSAS